MHPQAFTHCTESNVERPLSQGGGRADMQLVGWVGRDTNIRLSPVHGHTQQASGLQGHTSPLPCAPGSELSCWRPVPVGVFLCATPFIRGDVRWDAAIACPIPNAS